MSGQLRELIGFSGLVSNPNEFVVAGVGAMREFTNMRALRPNLGQKRPGVIRNAVDARAINKIFNYDLGQLFHSGSGSNGRLKKWVPSTSVVTSYSANVEPTSGRLRSCISNKNFYAAGTVPWRLSGISGSAVAAGGLFAPGFDRLATSLPAGTILATGKSTAYRSLFYETDAKGTTHFGEPSGRLVVTNQTSITVGPTVRAIVPSTATLNHSIQFYRSGTVAAGTQPDDDLQLVFEQQLTQADITAGYVDLADIVPVGLRGAYIYTAPNGGDGDNESRLFNRAPPGCMELCDFAGRTWYGATTRPGEFTFSILSVAQSDGIQPGDVLDFNGSFTMTAQRNFAAVLSRTSNVVTVTTSSAHGFSTSDMVTISGQTGVASATLFGVGPFSITVTGATTFTYAETAADSALGTTSWAVFKAPAAGYYLLETTGTASVNNQTTALNLVSAINKYASNTTLWAQWISKAEDLDQAQILIRGRTAATGAFTVTTGAGSKRVCFNPRLLSDPITANCVRTLTEVVCTVLTGTHGLLVGEKITTTGGTTTGVYGTGPFTITSVTTTEFRYTETPGGNATVLLQVCTPYPMDASTADVEAKPNRVYYSKQQQPEATTRNGWLDVGSPDTTILAMKSQRGQIWVWKTDGIYRIRGDSPENFSVEAMDTSLRTLAVESVILFGNRCWGLTDRGVIAVSESGIEPMSNGIDHELRLMISNVAATVGPSVANDCFAVAHESSREYILHVPDPVTVDLSGAYGTCRYAYVYTSPPPGSSSRGSWGKWDWGDRQTQVQSPNGFAYPGKRCGVVGLTDDKLYLGEGLVGKSDNACIFQELTSATQSANFEDDASGVIPNVTLVRTLGTTVTGTTATGTDSTPAVGSRIRLVPTNAGGAAGGTGYTDFGPFVVLSNPTATSFTFASTGSNLTLAGVSVAVCNPVAAAMTWLLQAAETPGREKRWDELEVIFTPIQLTQNSAYTESQVAFSLTLSNETSSDGPNVIASQASQTARVWITNEMSRGSRLLVRITHATAAEVFVLAGIAIKSEVLNGAVSR